MSHTIIVANGSKWYGETPDAIGVLLDRLRRNVLDPSFEEFGNFVYPIEEGHPHHGLTHIWGNFYELSAVFDIRTDDPDLIARLTEAIRTNQGTPAYADAKGQIENHRRAEADRAHVRFLEQQREARRRYAAYKP